MAKQETLREIRRKLMAQARTEPGFENALMDARTLGFGCHNFTPRNPLCRLLGWHINVSVSRTMSSDGSFSIGAHCCPIHGIHYPRSVPKLPRPRGLRAVIYWLTEALLPTPPRLPKPAPAIVRKTIQLPSLWEPGSTAFWLDPELWSRTPEVNGRPETCWMYLDGRPLLAEKPRQRFEIRKVGGKILERHYIG